MTARQAALIREGILLAWGLRTGRGPHFSYFTTHPLTLRAMERALEKADPQP